MVGGRRRGYSRPYSLTSYISRIRRRLAAKRGAEAATGQLVQPRASSVAIQATANRAPENDPLAQAKQVLSQSKFDIRKLHNDGDPQEENIMAKNNTNGNENSAAIAAPPFTPTIHPILQGKGGVGKSIVASWLPGFLIGRGQPVRCFDGERQQRPLVWIEPFRMNSGYLFRDIGRIAFVSTDPHA
jgi:hypothetical protein